MRFSSSKSQFVLPQSDSKLRRTARAPREAPLQLDSMISLSYSFGADSSPACSGPTSIGPRSSGNPYASLRGAGFTFGAGGAGGAGLADSIFASSIMIVG